MVNIYKSYEKLNECCMIKDAEAFFNGYITSEEFDAQEIEAMEKVDGAKLLDKQSGTIKTPRGVTSIDNLSTGCKTVLTYMYMMRHPDIDKNILDISGCGVNALEYLFDIAEKWDNKIIFVLRHKDSVYQCKDRDYLVDGEKKITNLAYL